jgi:probable F420-dependent oxidoreductase
VTDRKFRFGVIVPKSGSGKELTEQARQAEALGFSSLFVPDHFIDHDLAPTVALAHVAAVTDTLRVGPLVLGNDYKHPVVLAREMATIDLLSDGRLELGIGAGWMTADYEKAGMPLDRAGVRIARLAESITILKGLFAPGPFTFHGDHYQVTELDGMPKPPQGANLPFLIGGGAKKILGLAAREAKIVGINANLRSGDGETRETAQSLLPEATDQKLTWLREAAGASFADLEIQTLLGFVHVTDAPAGIAKAMADSFGVSEEDAILAPATLVGSIDGIIELLEQRRERWQMSYIVVPIESTEMLAPVVARLAGK